MVNLCAVVTLTNSDPPIPITVPAVKLANLNSTRNAVTLVNGAIAGKVTDPYPLLLLRTLCAITIVDSKQNIVMYFFISYSNLKLKSVNIVSAVPTALLAYVAMPI